MFGLYVYPIIATIKSLKLAGQILYVGEIQSIADFLTKQTFCEDNSACVFDKYLYLNEGAGVYYLVLNNSSEAAFSISSITIPEDEQKEMGLSDGIIRFSIGLDNDIERTYRAMRKCMNKVGVL